MDRLPQILRRDWERPAEPLPRPQRWLLDLVPHDLLAAVYP